MKLLLARTLLYIAYPFIYLGYLMTRFADSIATLKAEVTRHKGIEDSLIVLCKQIHDLLAAAVDTEDIAAVQEVIDMLKNDSVELAAAVQANSDVLPPVDPA